MADRPIVSRETCERLDLFENLLLKWNRKINLVSPRTLVDTKSRHITDSLQLVEHLPTEAKLWVDLGSGGGFPGMVVAIACRELVQNIEFVLIESDARKCAFLRTVSRETGVNVRVLSSRIEAVPPMNTDVISARALAPLRELLAFTERHMSPKGTAFFLKGSRWQTEVKDASSEWRFDFDAIRSVTEEDARILKISGVTRV